MSLPKPISRADMYLSYLNYTKGLTLANLPKPISREDIYLYNLCINRGMSGGNTGGTTTDNVVDRAGRTQEQINKTFYKRGCKEFTSVDGIPVTVNNGEEGYVLSAEIKGQTVKCIYIDKDIQTVVGTGTHWGSNSVDLADTPQLEPSKEYTIFMQVFENTLDGEYAINSANKQRAFLSPGTRISAGSTGLFSSKHMTQESFQEVIYSLYSTFKVDTTTGTIKFRRCIVEGDYVGKINSLVPFGLNSTEAIISNNGESYPIYATEEDKTNKKVISLPYADDKVTLNEDGSATWVNVSENEIINEHGNWDMPSGKVEGYNIFRNAFEFNKTIPPYESSQIKCENVEYTSGVPIADIVMRKYQNSSQKFILFKNSLGIDTVDKCKEWLKENNISIIGKSTSPITTHIPKELVPTILTNKTNILEVGGAVKPSSFKVTLPVDRLAEIEARLQALENTTVDVVLNK